MIVNEIRPFKRAKRRSTSDLCDFLSFPSVSGDGDGDCFAEQPFWSAVQSFLKQYGHSRFPPSLFPSLVTWQILLRVGDPADGAGVVSLDVVEEDVARSRSVYCDQCRVVGWSGHPVCRKRYHFIIRANSNPIKGSHRACTKCGNMTYLSDSRCKLCNTALTVDELEDWVYHQFEDTTHLLHGVVHSNGYGHLLRVNGREGGADILSGFDIMNFWDRLCKRLAVRFECLFILATLVFTRFVGKMACKYFKTSMTTNSIVLTTSRYDYLVFLLLPYLFATIVAR